MARYDTPSWRARYGPWALVTGASDGIGRETARQAAAAGLNLVIVARRADALNALAGELTTTHGVDVRVMAQDLSDPAGVDAVVDATADLDVGLLVASAGFGTSGPFVDGDLDRELDMLAVNCRALLVLSHVFARRMVERGRGGIVLMSSLVAFQGVPNAAHYAATKAYVQSLAEALRIELTPRGVDVLASAPGPIASGFAQRADVRISMSQTPDVVARGTLRALGRTTTVRPGWLSKFLEALLTLPRWARVRIMRRVMGGMTAHQTTPGIPDPADAPRLPDGTHTA